MQQVICVYCGASSSVASEYVDAARDLGRRIAARGHALVYGGGSRGLMGEVARAANDHGAHVIGVIPQMLITQEQAYQASDELIITDGLRERKAIMESRATAFIGLAGGLGTFDELFEALTHRQLLLHNKPIVLVDTNGFYQPFVRLIEHIHEQGFVKATYKKLFHVATDAEAAIDYIERCEPVEIESRFT